MKLTMRITVSGPGGCISPIVNEIEDFLKSRGHDVEVENEHPCEIRQKDSPWIIKLKADHQPWGG